MRELRETHGEELKELKEFKEKDKDLFEGKLTDVIGIRQGGPEAGDGGTQQRLAALEQTVQQLVHFIGKELRPDLTRSALQGSSQAAKDEKDLKDAEKLSEG